MSRISRQIKIGGFDTPNGHIEAVTLGGGFPPVIQTMWKDRLSFSDLEGDAGRALLARIEGLKNWAAACFVLPFLTSPPQSL